VLLALKKDSLAEITQKMRTVREGMLRNPLQQLYLKLLTPELRRLTSQSTYDPAAVLIKHLHTGLSGLELYSRLSSSFTVQKACKIDPGSAIVYFDTSEAGSLAVSFIVSVLRSVWCDREPAWEVRP
jgi:hypothetical protein